MGQKGKRRLGGLLGALLALFAAVVVATPALAEGAIGTIPANGFPEGSAITGPQINAIIDSGLNQMKSPLSSYATVGWRSGTPTDTGGTIVFTITNPNAPIRQMRDSVLQALINAFKVQGYPVKQLKLTQTSYGTTQTATLTPYQYNSQWTGDGSTNLSQDVTTFINTAFANLVQDGTVGQLDSTGANGTHTITVQCVGRGTNYNTSNGATTTYEIQFAKGWATQPDDSLPAPSGDGTPAVIENEVNNSVDEIRAAADGMATIDISGTTVNVEITDEEASTSSISSTVVSGIVGAARMAGASQATSVQNSGLTLKLASATQAAIDQFTAQCVAAAVPINARVLAVGSDAGSLENMTCGINVQSPNGDITTYTFNFYGEGQTPEPMKPSTPVYRLYNWKTEAHLLTTDEHEVDVLTSGGEWIAEEIDGNDESIAFYLCDGPETDGVANARIWRVYNPDTGEHLYTAFWSEVDKLTKVDGWHLDDVEFYAPTESTVPVWRLYNPNATSDLASHLWTTDGHEAAVLSTLAGNMRWQLEGIDGVGFYALYNQYGTAPEA